MPQLSGFDRDTAAFAGPPALFTGRGLPPPATGSGVRTRLPRRLRAWATAADSGEIQWAARRSRAVTVACWFLVSALVVGAFIARAHLGSDAGTWILLTAANALALAVAIGGLRRARLAPVMYMGIMAVFLIGGVFQLYLFSYHLTRNPSLITDHAPFHGFVTPSDVADVYLLISVAFVIFCLMVTVLTAIPVRTGFPRVSTISNFRPLTRLLVWATIAYAGFTVLQLQSGIGHGALYNPALPFNLVAMTNFYQRKLFPALLLLGIWAYDRRNPKATYLCLIGTGIAAAVLSYGATSRGAILALAWPVLFVWFLTDRFTKFRKTLLVGGFVVYLVLAPVLTVLRVSRVQAATGTSGTAATANQPVSVESLSFQLRHFVFRVGGANAMLFAIHTDSDLSLSGLGRVFRPSGLTSYFTHEVVGLPVSATITYSQAPTAIGLGALVGGLAGTVSVLVLTLLGLELAWRWMAKNLWTWPVALAILAQGALTFFSEGVPLELYKSLLAIAAVEVLYRYVVQRRPASSKGGDPQMRLPVPSGAAA